MRISALVALIIFTSACGSTSPTAPSQAAPRVTGSSDNIAPRISFGGGPYLVGNDIAAGRYYTSPGVSGCYWEREAGLGGSLGEVIANNFIPYTPGQWIVDILNSDRAFKADADCGTWFDTPRLGAVSTITPGMWLVGSQITPGTYRANASAGCYWERLHNFQGTVSASVLANDFISGGGQVVVTIAPSDAGFDGDGKCGTWTRISGVDASRSDSPSSQSLAEMERNKNLSNGLQH